KTPADNKVKLTKGGEIADQEAKAQYQSKIGSLNFLNEGTRPDISFAPGFAARYASNPNHILTNDEEEGDDGHRHDDEDDLKKCHDYPTGVKAGFCIRLGKIRKPKRNPPSRMAHEYDQGRRGVSKFETNTTSTGSRRVDVVAINNNELWDDIYREFRHALRLGLVPALIYVYSQIRVQHCYLPGDANDDDMRPAATARDLKVVDSDEELSDKELSERDEREEQDKDDKILREGEIDSRKRLVVFFHFAIVGPSQSFEAEPSQPPPRLHVVLPPCDGVTPSRGASRGVYLGTWQRFCEQQPEERQKEAARAQETTSRA
ncbi:MAG: hypothetical protein M1833_004839, partial [Piccolia ochrophora]